MPTIEIDDVTIVKRKVEIPEACPKCGTSFIDGDGDALRYEDIYFGAGYGYITYANNRVAWPDASIEGDADDFPESYATVEVACSNCRFENEEDGFKIEGKLEEHGEGFD